MIDAGLIEHTLEQVADRHGDPKALVYARLFELRPDFEDMFVMDTDGGVRGSMLQSSLDCVIGVARNDTQTPRHLLEAARMIHDGYGIEEADLDIMFIAMRDVFRNLLGNDWTPEIDAEWTKLLAELSKISLAS